MSYRKFELIIPVFFGCLGALVLSAFLMMHSNVRKKQGIAHVTAAEKLAGAEHISLFNRIPPESPDFILELYRNPRSQWRVFNFFAGICASAEIAEVILFNANSFNISPALAVALAWEESRFDTHAVNSKNRNNSIDRGLFQLNNRSFPRLEVQSFFSPETNAWYAMNHLRFCLDSGGTEVAALAMYNAGATRVNSVGTPKTTLDYISRIMENRHEIEDRFKEQEALFREQLEIEALLAMASLKPEPSRLVPLMPLAGHK